MRLRGWMCAATLLAAATAHGFDWARLHSEAERVTFQSMSETEKSLDQQDDAVYVCALRLLAVHQDEAAERYFKAILARSPDSVGAAWGVGEVARRRHDLDRSRDLLEKVVKREPAFWPAVVSLSRVVFLKQDFHRSLELAEKVTDAGEKASDSATFALGLVMVGEAKAMLAHTGGVVAKVRYGAGVQANLERAAKLRPDMPDVMLNLGAFYVFAPGIAGGDFDKGVGMLGKAIEKDPLLTDAYVRLGQAHRMKGEEQEYQSLMEQARTIDPKSELVVDVLSGKCVFICVDKK